MLLFLTPDDSLSDTTTVQNVKKKTSHHLFRPILFRKFTLCFSRATGVPIKVQKSQCCSGQFGEDIRQIHQLIPPFFLLFGATVAPPFPLTRYQPLLQVLRLRWIKARKRGSTAPNRAIPTTSCRHLNTAVAQDPNTQQTTCTEGSGTQITALIKCFSYCLAPIFCRYSVPFFFTLVCPTQPVISTPSMPLHFNLTLP